LAALLPLLTGGKKATTQQRYQHMSHAPRGLPLVLDSEAVLHRASNGPAVVVISEQSDWQRIRK